MESWREELYHHGIKGMKWGQRNGPPYPLNQNAHSASEKKAHWQQSLAGSSESVNSRTTKVRTISTNQNGSTKAAGNVDVTTGFRKISGKQSPEESLRSVNPHYSDKDTNLGLVTPYNRNCGNTVVANELRKRGLDVEARGNNWGMTTNGMIDLFDGVDKDTHKTFNTKKIPKMDNKLLTQMMFGTMNPKKFQEDMRKRGEQVEAELCTQLSKAYPPGSRGGIMVSTYTGSHFMSFEIDKSGRAKITNPQNPNLDQKLFLGGMNQKAVSEIIRMDNLSVKKNGRIKQIVMDRGSDADKSGMEYDMIQHSIDTGTFKVNQLSMLNKAVTQYFGPRWDGSWDAFNPNTQKILKSIRI